MDSHLTKKTAGIPYGEATHILLSPYGPSLAFLNHQ